MKKSNNLGFMLIETLLVSTFVLGVLTYLFMQFSALKRSYDDNFKYDTVPALYGIKNVYQYIAKNNGFISLVNSTGTNGYGYVKVSCVPFGATCEPLLDNLNVEAVYFLEDKLFKDNISTDISIFDQDDELYRFAKKINFSAQDNAYHLIVKYNDNTFATMAITL